MFSKLLVKVGLALALATAGGVAAVAAIGSDDLPTQASDQARSATDAAGTQGVQGDEGQATGEAQHEAAEAYAAAVREWTDCVADAAAAQGDESTREEGAFDPRTGCGERPEPGDFGLTDPPAQAEQGQPEGAGAAGQEARPESTPTPAQTPPGDAPVPEETPPTDPRPDETPPAGQPTPPRS